MQTAIWKESSFITLLKDSFLFLELSEQNLNNDIISKLYARTAILNMIFSLEAAANCCLDIHPCSKSLLNSIEKFSPIDKFEFLLTTRNPNKKIDRGSILIQSISELIQLRNQYVHPKPNRIETVFEPVEKNKFQFSSDDGKSNFLKIPKSVSSWSYDDAVKALHTIIDFYNHFFIDLCLFEAKYMNSILFPQVIDGDKCSIMLEPDLVKLIDRVKLKCQIDIKFIDYELK
jgi:hypothetical protein